MKQLVTKYRIQLVIGILTLPVLIYFPPFIAQLAILSYLAYLGFSTLFLLILRKYKLSRSIYVSHMLAFLLGYFLLFYIYAGFVISPPGLPMFL